MFVLAAFATFLGGLILIRVPYRDPNKTPDLILTDAAKKEYSDTFKSYVRAQSFYTLNMSLIWPLFAIILIKVLEVDNMVLVIFSVIGAISEMAFQPIIGRLVDRVGPLPVLIMSRVGFAILPFIYAFFPDIRVMIALQIVINFEEGGENNILHGDKHSETFLSEIIGAKPINGRIKKKGNLNNGLNQACLRDTRKFISSLEW